MTPSPVILPKFIINLKSHKLITNTGVYVLGNALQQALNFVLIPVYTRFLTPEEYGITGVTLAVGGVLTSILGFGIYGSVARHYYDYKDAPEQLKQFITTNFLFLVLVAGGVTLALNYWGELLWFKITSGQVPFSPYMRIVLWTSYATILLQVPLALYRTQQKAASFMIAQLSSFSLSLTATILLVVVWRMGAVGQLLGRLVAFGATATVLSGLLIRHWFSPYLRWRDLSISLAFGLPLIPHQLSGWALTSIDRILLEPRIPLADVGLYNLGYQIGLVMLVLVTSINMAWSPYYYNLMKSAANPERRIQQVTALYTAIVGGICLVGVLFSREILFLLAPPRYYAAAQYAPLIMFSYLLNGYYYFASMPLFYYKATHWVPVITVTSALLNIGLNLWWIPLWGAFGSAWATLVAYAATLVIAYLMGQHWQKLDYPLPRFGVMNGVILIGVLLATYVTAEVQLRDLVWKFVVLLLFAGVAYLWLIKPNRELLRTAQ
jgi:O-antigen/teichoic acid export membrane protein